MSPPASPPLTTFTLFGFRATARPWAFVQMGLAPRAIARTRGLRFWKLVGSGRGLGFSLRPDFSRYGLLAVWKEREAADRFFAESEVFKNYCDHSFEQWTIRMEPVAAHGRWSGVMPFEPVPARAARAAGRAEPVAVLTRATIRTRRLPAFWSAVPAAAAAVAEAPGLVASIGIGEVPWVQQATFSLWRSEADIRAYAYEHPAHRDVIRRTRDEGWYTEELFARFRPLAAMGTWSGREPLAEARAAASATEAPSVRDA